MGTSDKEEMDRIVRTAPDGWFDAREVKVPKKRMIELAKQFPDVLESHRAHDNTYFRVRRCQD